jgi:hypothetical protein
LRSYVNVLKLSLKYHQAFCTSAFSGNAR